MITLIGIGHVFSIREAVKYIIYQKRPHAVCVELDQLRFDALEKGLDRSEDAPFLMKRLQKIYNKAADISGAEVGEEMLGAVEAAKTLGIPHYFIDVEATPMVSGLLDGMSISQKLKLAGSVLGASVLPRKHLEKGMEELQKDPSSAMEKFGKVFPELKERIVDYRDAYMAAKLRGIQREHPHTVAVVGEGHMGGMSAHLGSETLELIHLKEVKEVAENLASGRIKLIEPERASGNSQLSIRFEVIT